MNPDDPPPEIVELVRGICGTFPDVVEEPGWVGVRWRVRKNMVAHVLGVDGGRPPVVSRAAGTDGPAVVLVFWAAEPELSVLRAVGPPFFTPTWNRRQVGMLLDDPDPAELTELLTESYLVRAPRTLADAVRDIDRAP